MASNLHKPNLLKNSQVDAGMTYQINVLNDAGYEVDSGQLRMAAETVLSQHDIAEDNELSVVIRDDDFVRALNRQFRDIDSPTDVLSFPAERPPVEIDDEPPYLGDLIIGYPYAAAQSAREGHALSDSLMLLVVHGTLHLLGYDHDTSTNRAVMWAAQQRALLSLDIPLDIIPALEVASHDDPA